MSLWHRDAFGRGYSVNVDDAAREHYINPGDGRLAKLLVQRMEPEAEGEDGNGDDDGIDDKENSEWVSIGPPREHISPVLRLVYWAYSSVLVEGSETRRWTTWSTIELALKWIPCCLLLVLMLLIPQDLEGQTRNNGYYDPVHYRDWGYAKVPRNRGEARSNARDKNSHADEDIPLLDNDDLEMDEFTPPSQGHGQNGDAGDGQVAGDFDEDEMRGFGPRYLCFLQDGPHGPDTAYKTWKVTDQTELDTDYVFVSYTRKQFCVETNFAGWDLSDTLRPAYEHLSRANRSALLQYGITAARSAGKRAFWIDFECIRDADGVAEATSQSYDVYRICDIVRAASSMVIVVGPPIEDVLFGEQPQPFRHEAVTAWLQQWGSRLWTLPEILLCPNEHRIHIYAVGGPSPTEQIAKRNFAARAALADATRVRQLIDHYESSIHLTPLELMSLALECFAVRQTSVFAQGDMAYALMGLLRRRPLVNRNDSSFEAFARLSLANDSDKVLERLLCVHTQHPDAPWFDTKDAWGAFLWDIEPHCQVAGIVDDQTVSLDGAYGATIQWDSMKQIAFFKRPTLARTFAKIVLRGVPLYLIMGLVLTVVGFVLKAKLDQVASSDAADSSASSNSAGSSSNSSAILPLLIIGLIILIPSVFIALMSPVMLLNIYRGKFWSTQALFVGMEGIPADLGSVERNLFGFNHGRLKWSVAGSPLSRHALSPAGECVALPPDPPNVPFNSNSDPGGNLCTNKGDTHALQRVFTVVDTYTMVATAFWATRPPTTVMICGQEGGMQRAVLCSYDWRRAAFSREAVIRLNTTVLDRMFRINRFRFALRRRADEKGADYDMTTLSSRIPAGNGYSGFGPESKFHGKNKRFWENRNADLALLPFMWFVFGVYFTSFYESFSHMVMIGCVTGVAVAAVQMINYRILQSLQIGQYLAAAVLMKGIAGLVFSVIELTDPDQAETGTSSILGGDIVLSLLLTMADAIITPCFVVLTACWYGEKSGQIPARLLFWVSGPTILEVTLYLLLPSTYQAQSITNIVFAIICILLSFYAFNFVDMPSFVTWYRGDQKGRSRGRKRRRRGNSPLLVKLLANPVAWFAFGVCFFGAASLPLDEEVFNQDLLATPTRAQIAESNFIPLLIAMVLCYAMIKLPDSCVPIVGLTSSLAFVGRMLFVPFTSELEAPSTSLWTGSLLLRQMIYYSQYFIWLALLLHAADGRGRENVPAAAAAVAAAKETDLVLNICAAFVGAAAGQVLGYGALWGLTDGSADSYSWRVVRVTDAKVFMSVLFTLQMILLLAWFLWLARRRSKRSVQHGAP